jgi:hypothetical protein
MSEVIFLQLATEWHQQALAVLERLGLRVVTLSPQEAIKQGLPSEIATLPSSICLSVYAQGMDTAESLVKDMEAFAQGEKERCYLLEVLEVLARQGVETMTLVVTWYNGGMHVKWREVHVKQIGESLRADFGWRLMEGLAEEEYPLTILVYRISVQKEVTEER